MIEIKSLDSKKKSRGVLAFLICAVGVSIIAISVLGLLRRHHDQNEVKDRKASAQAGIKVELATVKKSESERTILLTGETRAFYSVTLYARVSGYMNGLFSDIGDRVKKGQLLAHIESPEQEEAYNSARANAYNLRRIAERLQKLLKKKLVSPQQTEQAVSNAEVAEANLKTQLVIRDYQDIIASFDGIISNRFIDPGSLLQNASGSQSASQPLFTISQTDRLRIFIYIDQKDAPFVKAGDPIEVRVPGQTVDHLSARISMLAAELDPRTRTLLAEIVTDNPGQKIVAGSFVQVQLKVRTPSYMELPIQALVLKKNEPYVSVMGPKGDLNYQKIDLVQNTGETILIRSGLKVGDRVALNVGNTLNQGQKLRPENREQAGKRGTTP